MSLEYQYSVFNFPFTSIYRRYQYGLHFLNEALHFNDVNDRNIIVSVASTIIKVTLVPTDSSFSKMFSARIVHLLLRHFRAITLKLPWFCEHAASWNIYLLISLALLNLIQDIFQYTKATLTFPHTLTHTLVSSRILDHANKPQAETKCVMKIRFQMQYDSSKREIFTRRLVLLT